MNDPGLAQRIEKRLHPLVSPEVIAHDEEISHEAIYAWIYRSRPDLKTRLPQRGKKRRRYGSKREQIYEVLAKYRDQLSARSFTFDRGSAFSLWRMIEQETGASVYFAHARAPWERGTNENTRCFEGDALQARIQGARF